MKQTFQLIKLKLNIKQQKSLNWSENCIRKKPFNDDVQSVFLVYIYVI